jgi:hypothetical protein
VIALLIVACAPNAEPAVTPDPYAQLTQLTTTIAAASVVEDAHLTVGDALDPPIIDVTLRLGAGEDEARELVCTVVRPALLSARLATPPGVDIWDSTGRRLGDETSCAT